MFDQFKAMGQIAGLLKNKERLKESMDQVRATLEATRVEGSAGGGAVRVTASGSMQIIEVALDPALAAGLAQGGDSQTYAESLIAEATNDAIARAQQTAKDAIARESEALGLPDLSGAMGDFLPGH